MKLRSFFITLAVVSVILLSLGGGSFYWLLAQSPLSLLQGGVRSEPAAAIFLPKQTAVMISLLVNPDRLESFRQLVAAPDERRRAHQEFNQLKNSLLANTGLDYQTDVRPWLGDEVTLAVTSLDFDRNGENGTKPGYLLAVTTKDKQRATDFLQLYFAKATTSGTTDLVFEDYKGVGLIYQTPLEACTGEGCPKTIASAVVGDFVVFANNPKVLRDAINNVQATDLNLQNSRPYQQALQTTEEKRIGVVFADLPKLSSWLASQPALDTNEVKQRLAVALALNRQGLVAETALIGAKDVDEQGAVLSEPVEALQYIPGSSVLTLAGEDLNQLWEDISGGLETDNPAVAGLLTRAVASLQGNWGLNLPEDIFSWVQGEYALALMPQNAAGKQDWVFVAEKTPESEAAIANLDDIAKNQGLSVGKLPFGKQDITAWTKLVTAAQKQKQTSLRLEAEVGGVRLSTEKYDIFATSLDTLSSALAGKETSLVNSKKFAQAIANLPKENNGYLYIDWRESEPAFAKNIPAFRIVELAGRPLFENLRSLTLSSSGSKNGVSRATAFFKLNDQ
ncbi:MAG: DUF3352 domain-containing protein [Spirulinaceae cyanobacterium]